MDSIEKLIKSRLNDAKFNEVGLLNDASLGGAATAEACDVVGRLLATRKENYRKSRHDLGFAVTVDSVRQLAPSIDHLDRRLQEHMRMLRQNEDSLSGTNTVLEYDSAKSKADRLVEILRAKMTWASAYEEIQLLEPADRALRYQKLVELQKSFDVLHKYTASNSEREQNFERMKDEFLSWFSSATVLAIDTNDVKQVESLREKYAMLNRAAVFEQIFGTYSKNKLKCFVEEEGKERSIWEILQEVFAIWRRCYKLSETFVGENGSTLIAENLYEGVVLKWDEISRLVSDLICSSETPFKAAREIGKVCSDFLAYVETEGDEIIFDTCKKICQRIFSALSDDYGKHVTSVLLCTINKITVPEKHARHRHDWLLSYVDEIHSCMLEMVSEAKSTFGADFSEQIVPSFEKGIKELNSLLTNQDIFNVRGHNTDIKAKKSVHENTEDKISAICVTGALLNVVDNINAYINDCFTDCKGNREFGGGPQLISNKSVLEKLNRKVIARKIEAIANSIIHTMNAEMMKLKLSMASSANQSAASASDAMKISLPSFSTPPHNYITNVGHGLLNAMNTISLYGTNKNFVCAIMSVAGKNFNDDEADLWILTEIGSHVMEAFCQNIGSVSQLDVQLVRQFNADIVFFMEALVDLRLQPTARLVDYASKLKQMLNNVS